MTVRITSPVNGSFQQTVDTGAVQFLADIEPELGGSGQSPAPFDLLFGAWGACTNMTLQVYCRRKGWPLHRVETVFEETEQADPAALKGKQTTIQKTIRLWGPLTPEQVTHLKRVAEKCPVNLFLGAQPNTHSVISFIESVMEG